MTGANQLVQLLIKKLEGKRGLGGNAVDKPRLSESKGFCGLVGHNAQDLLPLLNRAQVHGLKEEILRHGGDFPGQGLKLLFLGLADHLVVQDLPIPGRKQGQQVII